MMAARRMALANRRHHEAVEFEHGGMAYVAGIGRFADGRIAEIFLNGAKHGSTADAAARDAAIVASLALQHGTPIETLRKALTRDADGSASGPLGAMLDLLAAEGAL